LRRCYMMADLLQQAQREALIHEVVFGQKDLKLTGVLFCFLLQGGRFRHSGAMAWRDFRRSFFFRAARS
jgi:hypothetical protein